MIDFISNTYRKKFLNWVFMFVKTTVIFLFLFFGCPIYIHSVCCCFSSVVVNNFRFSVDKKIELDVTFCILYFSSNSCSTCFGQPCANHQELTTA